MFFFLPYCKRACAPCSKEYSCCATVLAYITRRPAVCYASMSLPVQQLVLHIPRFHHTVRGVMLIGLKVWKSPLSYPLALSLKCTHTGVLSISRHKTPFHPAFGGHIQYCRKQSTEDPYSQSSSHYQATVFHLLTVLCPFCPAYKSDCSPVAETTH